VLILFDLDILPSNEGFEYLRKAIEIGLANSNIAITKELYSTVSQIYDGVGVWASVEQAIRRAIQTAWKNRDEEIWNIFFPPRRGKKAKCPSNKEFITRITCIIELWQSCKEADYEKNE